jgi:hypothetical protein
MRGTQSKNPESARGFSASRTFLLRTLPLPQTAYTRRPLIQLSKGKYARHLQKFQSYPRVNSRTIPAHSGHIPHNSAAVPLS